MPVTSTVDRLSDFMHDSRTPPSLTPPPFPQSWNVGGSAHDSLAPVEPVQSLQAINNFSLPEGMSNLIVLDKVQEEPTVVLMPPLDAATDSKVNYQSSIPIHEGLQQQYPTSIRPPSIDNSTETSTVPRPIPKEVQVLVDAYIHNTPVLCIASKACMTKSWSVTLPSEVEFAYLGFHSIIAVQEERVPQDGRVPTSSDLAGRAKWEFKLQWGSGGEEYLGLPSDSLPETVAPWWLPPHTSEAVVSEPASTSTSSDNVDASTPEYKHQRLRSHNYSFRNTPIANRCPSILPLHLLVPHNDSAELGFGPEEIVEEHKGWYCAECGKLNRVVMMRHRRCSSSFCVSKVSSRSEASCGYSVLLECLRSPHEMLPAYLPTTKLPPGVGAPAKIQWPNGMMVLRYVLGVNKEPAAAAVESDQPGQRWAPNGEVSARYIFTGNMPSLQLDATELLDSIQTSCELVRDANDSPYFSHTASIGLHWPECLRRAREVIAKSVKTYVCSGDQEMDIQRLLVKGWVDSGSRRGTDLLNVVSSGNCVAMMCLGHNLTLKIFPKSGYLQVESNPNPATDGMLIKMADDVFGSDVAAFTNPQTSTSLETLLDDGEKEPPERRELKVEGFDGQTSQLMPVEGIVLESSSASTPTNDQMSGAMDGVVLESPPSTSEAAVIPEERKHAPRPGRSGATDGVLLAPSPAPTPTQDPQSAMEGIIEPSSSTSETAAILQKRKVALPEEPGIAEVLFEPSTPTKDQKPRAMAEPSSAAEKVVKKRRYTRKTGPEKPETAEVLVEPSTPTKNQSPGAMDGVVPEPSEKAVRKRRKAVPPPQKTEAVDSIVVEPSFVSTPTVKKRYVRKPTVRTVPPQPFIVTLVHGDILVLSGDDFNYSIVRSGTSILLVAFG
ncbi:hypothetical protein B0H19DRAFT_496616 [Mycena capillaripes]|nr:hypothetical protein B0H19DRAFT_496616 [Mycena capillaripes]